MNNIRTRQILAGLSCHTLVANVAFAQTPSHDWTVRIGSHRFGLVGFDSEYTYVNYGLGQFYVPYSPVYVALSLLLGLVLIVAIAFAISQRNRRP